MLSNITQRLVVQNIEALQKGSLKKYLLYAISELILIAIELLIAINFLDNNL
ncbi:hypothetical protein [Eudoraea adriatica]|uniref:hypothetical protein n=1 Tax=Eudoraea adriatica TaxID=446681 RepID=UPI0003A77068|nr:hypothetical protein [Eudoraea adriatica]